MSSSPSHFSFFLFLFFPFCFSLPAHVPYIVRVSLFLHHVCFRILGLSQEHTDGLTGRMSQQLRLGRRDTRKRRLANTASSGTKAQLRADRKLRHQTRQRGKEKASLQSDVWHFHLLAATCRAALDNRHAISGRRFLANLHQALARAGRGLAWLGLFYSSPCLLQCPSRVIVPDAPAFAIGVHA